MVRHGSGGHRSGSIGHNSGAGHASGGHSSGGHHSSGTSGGSHKSGTGGDGSNGGGSSGGSGGTIGEYVAGGGKLPGDPGYTGGSSTQKGDIKGSGSQSQQQTAQQQTAQNQTVAQYLARGGSLPGTNTEAQRLQQQQQARNVIAQKYGLKTTAEYVAAGGYLPGTKTQQEATEQQKQATGYLRYKQQKKDALSKNIKVLKQDPDILLSGVDNDPNKGNYTVVPKDIAEQQQRNINNLGIGKPKEKEYSIITEYDKPKFTWAEFKKNPVSEIKEIPEVLRAYSTREHSKQLGDVATYNRPSATALAAGIVTGYIDPILNPIEFVKGAYQTTKGLLTDTYKTVDQIKTQFTLNPEGATGEIIGQVALFKTVAVAIKKLPVKFEVESYTFTTEGGGKVTVKTGGVKIREKGYPLGSKTTVDPAITNVEGGVVSTKVIENLPFKTDPYTAYSVIKPNVYTYSTRTGALNQPVAFGELGGSQTQPVTATGGEVIRGGLIDYSPAEITRVESNVRLSYHLGTEKGQPVKEFIVNIEGVKDPTATTKAVEAFVGEEGVIYGSLVSKELPGETTGPYSLSYLKDVRTGGNVKVSQFQNVKQGDVDIIFPDLTVAEIKPRVAELTKQLQTQGENVEVSPTGKGTIIQFKDTAPGVDNKFLEVKSGIDQAEAGLADEAPAAYLGIEFPDFHKGQVAKTVPFGKTRAITAGEQLQRKGAGATIMSSGQPGETPSFSEPGVLGKQGNPRGLKDTAGAVQQAAGIIQIKEGSINPLERVKAVRGKRDLANFLESYTPEQQTDILNKLDTITGSEGSKIKLDPTSSKIPEGESTGSPGVIVSDLGYSSSFNKGPSPTTSPTSTTSKISSSLPVSPQPSSIEIRQSLLSLNPSEQSKVEYYIGFKSPSSPISPHTESPSPVTSSYPSSSGSSSPSSGGGSPSPISPSPVSPTPSPSPTPISPSPSPSPVSPSPGPTSPSPYPFIPPQEKPIPKVSPFFKLKDDDSQGSYEVLVRRGGLFKRVATRQTAAGAVAFGKFRVETTAAASFKINPIGSRSRESVNVAASKLLPLGNFYQSKKEGLTFIEKKERRIKSQGEKKEITALGILSSKTKQIKKKKGFFGGF